MQPESHASLSAVASSLLEGQPLPHGADPRKAGPIVPTSWPGFVKYGTALPEHPAGHIHRPTPPMDPIHGRRFLLRGRPKMPIET